MNTQSEKRWNSLPIKIKKHFQTNPIIHYWIDAYCCGLIGRDTMYVELVSKLSDYNDGLIKNNIEFHKKFGVTPTTFIQYDKDRDNPINS